MECERGSNADPPAARSGVAAALEHTGSRWRLADPLLPAPWAPGAGCGASLAGEGGSGQQLPIVGSCEHWQGEADSLEVSWGAARRYRLTPLVGGVSAADVTIALDSLLATWREHLVSLPAAAEEDTAAVIVWPSRDVGGAGALLRRGFAPLAVIAARADRAGPVPAGELAPDMAPAGVRVRRASPADIEQVVRLGMEVVRFDGHFGVAMERPSTPAALTREMSELLSGPRPWVWLAERAGAPIGMLAAQRPQRARWIAPLTSLSPVAYLLLMAVDPAERGQGIGASLAARLNHEAHAARVRVTLLNYAQVNPLSVPFWSHQGYRPLWTYWEARPAAALR